MKRSFWVVLLLTGSLLSSGAFAQSAPTIGTEFWLGFMPNFDRPAEHITLSASCFSSCLVTVEYSAYPFGSPMRIDTFHISQSIFPNTPGVISIDLDRPVSESRSSEQVDNHSIHITSSAPISLSGYSMSLGSGEGFLALPLATLGKEYYTVNYPSFEYTESVYYPGEFLIVAPFDGTEVRITTRAITQDRNGKESHKQGESWTVTLGKGQTYLVQSSTYPLAFPTDLTGTHITSSAPIAVLSGHAYTRIESEYGGHLIEMLPPVESWSTKYHYANFDANHKTTVIIVAADTGHFFVTDVQNGNSRSEYLNPGDHFEEFVTSDGNYGKLLVSEFQKPRFLAVELRRSNTAITTKKHFHPTMSVVTGIEQRDSVCMLNGPARLDSLAPDYAEDFEYYGKDSDLTAIFGSIINVPHLKYFPLSPRQQVYHPDPQGVHSAIAKGFATSHPIVGEAYGTSGDLSYAHPSSMILTKRSTDHANPKLTITSAPYCGNYNISVSDSAFVSSPESGKLASVRPITGIHDYMELPSIVNYRIIAAGDFVAGSASYDMKLEVVDPRKDAFAAIYAQDLSGNDTAFTFTYIAGRTQLLQAKPKLYKIAVGHETCQTIAFAPKIDSLSTGPILVESVRLQSGMSNPYVKLVVPNLPQKLDKGDTLFVTICATADDTLHAITDSIVIFADCYERLYPFTAKGVTGILDAADVNFGETEANVKVLRDIKLINHGEIPLTVTGYDITGSSAFSGILIPPPKTITALGYLYIKDVEYLQPAMDKYDTAVIHWKTDLVPPYENSTKTYSILTAHTKPQSGVRGGMKNAFGIVSVSPNPAQTSFTIRYVSMADVTLHLYDMLGREVFSAPLPAGDNEELVSLPSLATGSYVLRLVSSEGVRERTLIIAR